ncbi:MAG: hypothetical protein ACREO3_08930 [Arenimonas sp.]
MRYASMSIDRRAEYYARCASLIASDPLDFYTRAEKGRRILANWMGPRAPQIPATVDVFQAAIASPKRGMKLIRGGLAA